jgi:hypothetical protein
LLNPYFLFAALSKAPKDANFIIDSCGQYIVDSATLKQNPDAIVEILQRNIPGNPKDRNIANDVRKFLTFFLRGFLPVVLEDKDELMLRLQTNPLPVRKKKRKASGKEGGSAGITQEAAKSEAGELKQAIAALKREGIRKDEQLAAAKLEAEELRQTNAALKQDCISKDEQIAAAKLEAEELRQANVALKQEGISKDEQLAAAKLEAEANAPLKQQDADVAKMKEELLARRKQGKKIGLRWVRYCLAGIVEEGRGKK